MNPLTWLQRRTLRRGIADIKAGHTHPWPQVKEELGIVDPNEWKAAVEDAAVSFWIGDEVLWSNPAQLLAAIIRTAEEWALDPQISEAAAKLRGVCDFKGPLDSEDICALPLKHDGRHYTIGEIMHALQRSEDIVVLTTAGQELADCIHELHRWRQEHRPECATPYSGDYRTMSDAARASSSKLTNRIAAALNNFAAIKRKAVS